MEKYIWCVDSTYCVTAGGHMVVNILIFKFVVDSVISRYGS